MKVFDDATVPRWLLAFPVIAHFALTALLVSNRAAYAVDPSRQNALVLATAHPIWIVAHVIAAILLIVWDRPPQAVWGTSISGGVLMGWGALALASGLMIPGRGVSLVGPVLAILFGLLSAMMARKYENKIDEVEERLRRRYYREGK